MIDGKRILTIIPARGGSKRLPRKNLLDLGGKPLIVWTIEAATGCDYVDCTAVSTDDEEIAAISMKHGAEVPVMRPAHLASDEATNINVVLDFLATLAAGGEDYDFVVVLPPTSPLRTKDHLSAAIEQMAEHKARAIISVCWAEHHPLWCNTLPDDLSMAHFIRDDVKNRRSQDLPVYYRLNGALYVCATELLTDQRTLLPSVGTIAYVMSQGDSIDIDTADDFERARVAVESRGK